MKTTTMTIAIAAVIGMTTTQSFASEQQPLKPWKLDVYAFTLADSAGLDTSVGSLVEIGYSIMPASKRTNADLMISLQGAVFEASVFGARAGSSSVTFTTSALFLKWMSINGGFYFGGGVGWVTTEDGEFGFSVNDVGYQLEAGFYFNSTRSLGLGLKYNNAGRPANTNIGAGLTFRF